MPTTSARIWPAWTLCSARCNNAANLAALKLKGWTDAETTAFQTARDAFGPAEQYRVKSISGANDTTTQKNADAATLYENILTIQNAADLQWPATDPANAGVRGEFLLGIFPPDHGRDEFHRRHRHSRRNLQNDF